MKFEHLGITYFHKLSFMQIEIFFGEKEILLKTFDNDWEIMFKVFYQEFSKNYQKKLKTIYLLKVDQNGQICKRKINFNLNEEKNFTNNFEIFALTVSEKNDEYFYGSGKTFIGKVLGLDFRFEKSILDDFILNKKIIELLELLKIKN